MSSESIDFTSEPRRGSELGQNPDRRPFLGIHFACCGIYARIYVNASGSAFAGNCPKCGRRIEVCIAPHGETSRFFSAY